MMLSGIKAEMGPLFTAVSWLPIPALQHTLNFHQRQKAYCANVIRVNKANVYAKEVSADEVSLFAKFFDPSKNQELGDEEVAHEASNLTVAASDTTAVSLTYLVYTVLRPENRIIKEKLLEEVNGLPLDASASDLGSLTYLRAVIDESLRLFGAAPGSLPRMVPEGGTTFGQYFLSAGTTVSTQAYTIHRDLRIFEDPET